jgi:hypothetical protein
MRCVAVASVSRSSSIEAFKASLFPSGGCLKGEVILSFFDKREVKVRGLIFALSQVSGDYSSCIPTTSSHSITTVLIAF